MPITATPNSQPTPTQAMWLKGISLKVREIDNRTYEVEGETGNHIVNVEDEIYSCSGCESFTYRGTCSHIASVLFDRMSNQERYTVGMGLVSEGFIVSTEVVNGKLIVKAEKEVKKKRRKHGK